jgi:hypothetical protein
MESSLKSPFYCPLLHFVQALATWVLPFMCMEPSKAMVHLQVMVWAFTELLLLKPMTNPFLPKCKLSSCSQQWLQSWFKYINDSFNSMAIYLDPLVHIKWGLCPVSQRNSTQQVTIFPYVDKWTGVHVIG